MSNLNNVIGELSELNNYRHNKDSDMLTIDLHNGHLYIYPKFNQWKDIIFKLDSITEILHKYGCSFYLSDTKYGKPAVVVMSM